MPFLFRLASPASSRPALEQPAVAPPGRARRWGAALRRTGRLLARLLPFVRRACGIASHVGGALTYPASRRVRLFVPQLRRRLCQPNLLAALIAGAMTAVLAAGFDPQPVRATTWSGPRFAVPATAQPVPEAVAAAGERKTDAAPTSALAVGRPAILMQLGLLSCGIERLEQVPAYTAVFIKQEQIDGELREPQEMVFKLRREPHSVYMKWLTGEAGREVLFVLGENDNRMLVKKGGRFAMLPAVNVDPCGSLAMAESRHPIMEAGLLHLAKTLQEFRRRDLQLKSGVESRQLANEKLFDRTCYCFETVYASSAVEPTYRRTIAYIDSEWFIPIAVRNYGWQAAEYVPDELQTGDDPELESLVEYYGFARVQLDPSLADADFRRDNEAYRFQRR